MIIRTADQRDFDACVRVLPRKWQEFGSSFKARLGKQLYQDVVFVAVDDKGKIMGFLACETGFFDDDGFYLRTIVVDEQYQQQGIARALVLYAIKWAFDRGARRVFADVIDKAFGDKLVKEGGFEKVGEIKHMHAEGQVFSIYSLARSAQPR